MTSTVTALKRFVSPLLLAAVAGLTLPAAAQTLKWGTGLPTLTEKETPLTFGGQTLSSNALIGALSVSTASTPTAANSFYVYCLDPLNGASLPSTYTTVGLESFIKGSGTPTYTALFNGKSYDNSTVKGTSADTGYRLRDTTQVYNNLVELYSHAYADSLTSTTKSAAFQYAVWTILGEDEVNYATNKGGLKDGDTTAGSFAAQANAYLTAVTSNNWGSLTATTTYTYQVFAASPLGGSQTFLAVSKATGGKVSEPASLALVGIAALGVVAGRRRKSESKA